MSKRKTDNKKWKLLRKKWLLLVIFFVGHIVLCSIFYNWANLHVLLYIGWTIFTLSIILGWIPRRTLHAKGKGPKGTNWFKSSVFVDSGIYAIIRHPMYLGFILLTISLILISQHWSSLILGVPMVIYFTWSMRWEEQLNVRKFRDDYINYMKRVPRINLILGIIRLLRQRKPNRVI